MRRWANSTTVRKFPRSPGPTTADCCSERQSEVLVEGEMSDHHVGQTLSGALLQEGRFLCEGSTGEASLPQKQIALSKPQSLFVFVRCSSRACMGFPPAAVSSWTVSKCQTVTLRLLPAAAIKTRQPQKQTFCLYIAEMFPAHYP